VSRLTGIGFVAVGLIGFLVKVIFIPINQVGAGHWPECLPACLCAPCLFAPTPCLLRPVLDVLPWHCYSRSSGVG
jgi:hypothetical protein